MQNELDLLRELGFTLPSPAYIVGAIVFGLVGLAAYYDGKRHGRPRERWIGLALMLYPYAIGATWLLYLVGIALCVGVWFDRRAT
jgi:apolipoprotein N-acyltransferase